MPKHGTILINVNDVIGKRLGKLEVIGYISHDYDMTLGGERMRHYYRVKCDCGTVKTIQRGQITSNLVHSCGCLRKERHHGH